MVNQQKIDLTPTQDGGVIKEVLVEGKENDHPLKGANVEVDYTGHFVDGTIFDSSHQHGNTLRFKLGKGQVISGWDICVASMNRGEKCRVTCSAKYAYGKRGSPPKIPPNSTLIFEIELHGWENEDISEASDKGIMKEIVEEGSDENLANNGSRVCVRLRGCHGQRVFDEREIDFILDEDEVENLVPAIPVAIRTMKSNERCRIEIASKYAFGVDGCPAFEIPPDADVTYDITMMKLERCKESWEMNDFERIEQSKMFKEKGTESFKKNDWLKAEKSYNKSLEAINYIVAKENGSAEDREVVAMVKKLKLALHLNLALCENKTKKFSEAVQNCDKALEIDASSEKAYFRRGEAQFAQINFLEAKQSFEQVVPLLICASNLHITRA